MEYQRFLTDKDYQALITTEHFEQLFRDIPERVEQAERSAEMNMLEYLDQYYEIEDALRIGKSIKDYSPLISYPSNVYVKVGGDVCKTIRAINGRKTPSSSVYWELSDVEDEKIAKYSQLKNYFEGDLVKFGSDVWRCVVPNGFGLKDVRIPGIKAWEEVESTEWIANYEYALYSVVSYDSAYYSLTGENEDLTLNPYENDAWSMIGEYSDEYEYSYGEDDHDYVVSGNIAYKPVLNPNADNVEIGVNVLRDDPRNLNVVTHMTRIALYYLHQLISPTNVSETRRLAYEDSIDWLRLASKFKLNPQIPRKIEKESGDVRVDWALATFQKDYNPYEDIWLI